MNPRDGHAQCLAAAPAPGLALAPEAGEPWCLRPGRREDVAAVARVMGSAFDPRFGEGWRAEQVMATLTGPGGRLLVLAGAQPVPSGQEPALAGFSLVRALAGEAELLLLATLPQLRRRGLGGKLLRAAMADACAMGAAQMFLEVREDNSAARRLYSAHGFIEVGRRPGYYRGEGQRRYHAVSMRCALSD